MMAEVVSTLVREGYHQPSVNDMTLEEVNVHIMVVNDRNERIVEAMRKGR
jgi:hypothetical protein